MRILLGIVVAVALSAGTIPGARAMSQDDLPDALVNLAYSLRMDPELLRRNDQENSPLIKSYKYIINIFGENANDILMKFIFTAKFCKLQSNSAGYYCGDDGDIISDPTGGTMFVTTPVPNLDQNIILVLSSESPEQTQIYIINNNGVTRKIYDSLMKENLCRHDGIPQIRTVYLMATVGTDNFLLRESGNQPASDTERNFKLVLDDKGCSIHMIPGKWR